MREVLYFLGDYCYFLIWNGRVLYSVQKKRGATRGGVAHYSGGGTLFGRGCIIWEEGLAGYRQAAGLGYNYFPLPGVGWLHQDRRDPFCPTPTPG